LAREMPCEAVERYLRDVEIGMMFAARAGFAELASEGASERELFDLALRGDAAEFRALLAKRLTAFERASADFKRDHIAFCVRTEDGAGAAWSEARESCSRALRRAVDTERASLSPACSVPSMQACEWLAALDADAFCAPRKDAIDGRVDVPSGSWTQDPASGGSEAMARQLLLARSFARDRFGAGLDAAPPMACAPRDLSYARQLPQLCRSAGIERL